jgi:tetratricopeptide (TPR) repeat protein
VARLYYDYGDYSSAITPFQKAIEIADEFHASAKDPIGYADVLEDYRDSLEKSQNTSRALEIQEKIHGLRIDHPGARASFQIVRFNAKCKRVR